MARYCNPDKRESPCKPGLLARDQRRTNILVRHSIHPLDSDAYPLGPKRSQNRWGDSIKISRRSSSMLAASGSSNDRETINEQTKASEAAAKKTVKRFQEIPSHMAS